MLCLFLLIIGRIVNVAVPFLFAGLVYVFEQGVTSPPWLLLLGYVGLRFLQSSGGLPALRDVRRTCLLSHSRPVHLNRLYPDFLDPGVAIFGSRCVRWMFSVDKCLIFFSRNVSVVLPSPPSPFFCLAYSSQYG